MKTKLYNQSGEETGAVQLPDRIFKLELNPGLIHQALTAQLANSRQNLANSKGRGEVRGGGKKPWRQKGTGRARHGSTRSPIWKGGGVTFGPTKERNFKKKINKKMKQKAIFMSLSSKVKDKEFIILDVIKFKNNKTKEAKEMFDLVTPKFADYKKSSKKQDSVLVVFPDGAVDIKRAMKNLPFAGTISAASLNVKDILSYKYLMLLKDSISVINKTYKLV